MNKKAERGKEKNDKRQKIDIFGRSEEEVRVGPYKGVDE